MSSYRSADDSAALQEAIRQVFAEVGAKGASDMASGGSTIPRRDGDGPSPFLFVALAMVVYFVLRARARAKNR